MNVDEGSGELMDRQRFVYVGWQGHENFGDDILLDVWRRLLGSGIAVEAPLHAKDYVRSAPGVLRGRKRAGRDAQVLLGGGTALGFRSWAQHVRLATAAYGADSVVVLGAGAAEGADAYARSLQRVDWRAWRKVKNLRVLGVRGPLSQQELRVNLDLEVEVLGDPALMYPYLRPTPAHKEPTLGICLGSQESTRFDVSSVADAARVAVAELGWDGVRVIGLAASDRPDVDRLTSALGDLVRDVHLYAGDVAATTEIIGTCGAFVSERLHGAILAVALGVPTVPLAYASKCDDFWLSVNSERPSLHPGCGTTQLVDEFLAAREDGGERTRRAQSLAMASLAAVQEWTPDRNGLASMRQTTAG
jgi:hypothetical protein